MSMSAPDELHNPDRPANLIDPPLPADLSEILTLVIRWAVEMMRADAGEIFLWDQDKGVLVQAISLGFIEAYHGISLKPGEGLGGKVYLSGEPMLVPDYANWDGGSPGYDPIPRYICTFGIPLKWRDEIVGVLALDADSRRRAFDQNDIRRATLFANLASLAIKNAQIYENLENRSRTMQRILEDEVAHRTAQLQHRALQLETSARVSREIAAILDMERLLAHIVEDIQAAFDYYNVSIFMLETDPDQLKLQATSGGAESDLKSQGLTISINDNSLNSRAVLENQAVIVNDVSLDKWYQAISLLPDTQSELIIPLRVGNRVIGTLDVQSNRSDEFSQEDVLVIQSLGDQIAIAIENARLVEQSQELAVLEERTRLARELHDSVAQSLFSIDLSARAVSTYLKKNRAKADEELQQLRKTAHDALQEMRSLIFGLRPVSFQDTGLLEAIRNEISRLQQRGGSEIVLVEEGICPLTPRIEHHLFRIAQETVRNALVHSNANKITVKIGYDDRWVQLSVWDDGQGFDVQQMLGSRTKNFGLVGLTERVEMLHGELKIDSHPGKGTRIDVRLPRPR